MPRVLLTAFKPYGPWQTNASWLAVVELTKEIPSEVELVTRLYPVDYSAMREQLEKDLDDGYDFALHAGQAPGSAAVRLEAVGLNLRCEQSESTSRLPPLETHGPMALQSDLPLTTWAHMLHREQIPAEVSYHAGTYLCNAALYYSLYLSQQKKLATRSAFIHLPLDVSQVTGEALRSPAGPSPSLATSLSAAALRLILKQLLLA